MNRGGGSAEGEEKEDEARMIKGGKGEVARKKGRRRKQVEDETKRSDIRRLTHCVKGNAVRGGRLGCGFVGVGISVRA